MQGNLFVGTILDDRLFGTNRRDILVGLSGDDALAGLAGNDTLIGGGGADRLFGGAGDDQLLGGAGGDRLVGGIGDDVFLGGRGADRFVFDPSNADLGHDLIVDLRLAQGDQIILNAADVFRADPHILGEDGLLAPSDFDDSANWDLFASDSGALTVLHPGGTIEVASVPFSEDLSFAALVELEALGLSGVVTPVPLEDTDVLLNARAFLPPRTPVAVADRSDDLLIGDPSAEVPVAFFFDLTRPLRGDDVIVNFTPGQDAVLIDIADLYRATGSAEADIDGDGVFTSADLDASEAFDLVASDRGALTIVYPNGNIEIADIAFSDETTFGSLFADSILVGTGGLGPDENGVLTSGPGDEFLFGTPDTAESFAFDPSNPDLGSDVIGDFDLGLDQIALTVDDVLAADPDLPGADGVLAPEDFDASENWDLVASPRGNLVVVHPGGTIEIAGLAFSSELSFEALVDLGALALTDATAPATAGLAADSVFGFADPDASFVAFETAYTDLV